MSIPPGDISSPEVGGIPTPSIPAKEERVGTLSGEHSVREMHTSTPSTPQESEAETMRRVSQDHVTGGTTHVEEREGERHIERDEKRTPTEEHVEMVRETVIASTNPVAAAPLEGLHPGRTAKQIEVENGLEPQIPDPGLVGHTIAARMRELKVPGVSVAVIDNGQVVWTQGYGTLDAEKRPGVLTQAGSISKVVTSLTVLSLIEQCRQTSLHGQSSGLIGGKRFDLDSDIRDFLSEDLMSHIDPEGITKKPGQEITIRRLLSHTAGIPGGGSEYFSVEAIDQHIAQVKQDIQVLQEKLSSSRAPSEESSFDAPFDAEERADDVASLNQELEKLGKLEKLRQEAVSTHVPNVDDMLEGRDPKLGPVQVRDIPGEHYEYSNPGFTILQKFVETVTGKPFTTVVQEQVLRPLGMTDSTYSPPIERTVQGNGSDGTPMLESWRIVPHSAAGGLWTTAKDFAQVALGIQGAVAGKPLPGRNAPLISRELASEMMTGTTLPNPYHYGLGLCIDQQVGSTYFWHSGATPGFKTFLIANGTPGNEQGVVILTNSYNGDVLCPEIGTSVAKAYNWPSRETLSMCQPDVKPTECFPVPTDVSDPLVLRSWTERIQGKYGYWDKKEDVGNKALAKHTVDLVFDEHEGKVFAKADGGAEAGGMTLDLIPLGPDVAYHRPNAQAALEFVRFSTDEKTGKRYLEMFQAKHILVE